jgi:HlyD family secretion protein
LGLGEERPSGRLRKGIAGVGGAVVLVLVALFVRSYFFAGVFAPAMRYATEPARRGDLLVTANATGTILPIDQVDIGSELSGTVRSVEVGYNQTVRAGQVLARLDTTRLEAQMLQSQAAVASAQASVGEARANQAEAESQLARLQHVRAISGGQVPAQQEIVAAEAAVARARAALASAQAAVAQAQATLDVQQTDLSKATIRSPIDGVVLTAPVRAGQTVAASLQAPLLFTLAKDLTHLQVDLAVDEADVAQVQEGQTATFTVDAWPGRTFRGRVTQVRYGARTIGGVVTYETLLAVDNPDLALRPGMTATAAIELRRAQQALLVPNAALRFAPPAREARRAGEPLGGLIPHKDQFDVPLGSPADTSAQPRVWMVRRGAIRAVPLQIGASDGTWTEVVGGAIAPGDRLAVGASQG